jgi:hypothetical protein
VRLPVTTPRETVATVPASRGPRLTGFLDGLKAAGRTLEISATEDGAGRWTYRIRSGDPETDAAVRAYAAGLGARIGEQELFGWGEIGGAR